MAPVRCCVLGCDSTSETQRLFCMPMNDNLRNLWMSLLVPVSSYLLGLSKGQLMTKRVCEKHFDKTQFSQGTRIRYSYPCLFTEKEILHGVPLSCEEYNVLKEHNYCLNQEEGDDTTVQEPVTLMGMSGLVHLQEHLYALPSPSQTDVRSKSMDKADVLPEELQNPVPSTSALPTATENHGIIGDVLPEELQNPPVPSTSALPAATGKHDIIADVSPEELQNPVPSTSALPTSTGNHGIIDDAVSPEHPRLVPAKRKIQGISCTRKPLQDISHEYNVKVTSQRSAAPRTVPKGTSTMKQLSAKTRRFIRQTTKIAVDSVGQTAAQRLKNAHELASQDIMLNFESLNKKARNFLLLQLRLARENKMARTYSEEDKLFALTLLKQSPKGYKLLENIFALPSKRTLARMAEKIVFECGINENVFNYIKHSTKKWDTKKRLCSLVFDEVALTPHLIYNESKDVINGFEEIAEERKQKFADHALVFMVRGICSSWRQSIAYYFCAGTVSTPELEKIFKQIIPRLSEAGLKPVALVCDQGSTFRSCFKNLKATTARLQTPDQRPYDTVHVAGHDLFMFHDPPHLLKSIRNNFMDKDIVFEGKRASWKDILYVYDTDMQAGHTRALPALTAEHVEPKRIKKMKVKMAAQVLSARTAAMLNYTASIHERMNMPMETMQTTAEAVTFFDELFDSVNGSPGQGKGKLRCAVKANSDHIEFWERALHILQNITFIDENSKLAKRFLQPRQVRVPCLEGWITTLNSFLGLSKFLFTEHKVEYFYTRFLNQDPLENFFGRIRALNYRNVNPDANTFIYSFKSLVLSNIIAPQSKAMNCEDDDGDTIIKLDYLFKTTKKPKSPAQSETENASKNVITPSSSSLTRESANTERMKVQISAYTAGYLCRKLTKKINCDACSKSYTTKEHQGIHEYIRHREYKRLKNHNLSYPNGKFLIVYRECAQIIHDYLNKSCHLNNVKKTITQIIKSRFNLSWLGCRDHQIPVTQYFLDLVIRLQVHNWTNIVNKILKGKVEEKYVSKMQPFHMAALKKYKAHRLKMKCTKSDE